MDSNLATNNDATGVDEMPAEGQAGYPDRQRARPARVRRRLLLPMSLFLLTCVSTFWVGTCLEPIQYLEISSQQGSLLAVRRVILENYQDGLIYMAGLLGILFAHEMGHFLATVAYGVPASFPYFLPLPITPIGTLGAVISVDGRLANRKQIFDIGLAGPIAGLLVAVPVMWYSATHLQLATSNGKGGWALEMPLGIWLILKYVAPAGIDDYWSFWLGHLQGNPLFVAGWVGFLITGLNMVPISQLDGGHVVYCLLGRRSYWVARGILLAVGVHVVWSFLVRREPSPWLVMAILVLFIGPYHPPTRDDSVPIGRWRTVAGYLSLIIPVLCLPLHPLRPVEFQATEPSPVEARLFSTPGSLTINPAVTEHSLSAMAKGLPDVCARCTKEAPAGGYRVRHHRSAGTDKTRRARCVAGRADRIMCGLVPLCSPIRVARS
ncbi:MAG: hypothetical protein KatS3mg110_1356 [Pirellulaceae bacterium]|nr:MAG: hypothetical protein KatS3mg110_1356 [Pirellulaceae bacterium]